MRRLRQQLRAAPAAANLHARDEAPRHASAQHAPPTTSAVAPEMEIPPFAVGVAYGVSPTEADPAVTRFTANNPIVYKRDVARNAPLLVCLSGTGGEPMSGLAVSRGCARRLAIA